ncbi:MAG: hypothetical protein ACNA8G_02035 [Gammaproteobacteria bacterium]
MILVAALAIAGCASTGSTNNAGETAAATNTVAASSERKEKVAALTPEDPGYWDEVICRREPLTGTRLTKARCHTRYDWERMRGAATETMRDIESKNIPLQSR